MRTVVTLCVVALAAASSARSATLHVCPDGSGQYADLQSALAAAVTGDEIELCAGVFTGYGNVDLHFGARDLVLRSVHGPEATTIDFAWLEDAGWGFDEFLAHPGIFLEPGTTTRIEGITLTGAGNRLQSDPGDGSTIHCVGGTLVLDRVHLRSPFSIGARSRRGGGVFVEGGTLTATDCVIRGFYVHNEGAALYSHGSTVALTRCEIRGNGNGYGGTIWTGNGNCEITDCHFEQNRGPDNPGVVITVESGQTVVTATTFLDNFAQCIWNRGQLLVQECRFDGNVAEDAAGIANSGTARVLDCSFDRHYAGFAGPAVIGSYGDTEIVRCTFSGNRGGSLWAPSTAACTRGTLVLRSCSFVSNGVTGGSRTGSALYVATGGRLTVENTIVAFSDRCEAVRCDSTGAVTASCSDFFGNELGDWTGCVAGQGDSAGNFSADPAFCDPASGDLHLHGASPCAPEQTGGCGLVGALGVGCGPTSVEHTSWGSIKALFR